MDDEEFLDRLVRTLDDQKTEADFLRLCALYRKASPSQRETLRGFWPPTNRWKVPRVDAFRPEEPPSPDQRLRAQLLYASIENLRMDWRDTLIGICAVYHAALKCGLDPAALFEETAALSTPEFAHLLQGFLSRSPEDRSLAAFGWKDASTVDGVCFLPR